MEVTNPVVAPKSLGTKPQKTYIGLAGKSSTIQQEMHQLIHGGKFSSLPGHVILKQLIDPLARVDGQLFAKRDNFRRFEFTPNQ